MSAVTFKPLSAYPSPPPRGIVHIKGFASRLDYSDPRTQLAADELVDAVRGRAGAVAFDGDDLGAGSFTAVVLRCHREANVKLVAFKYASERDVFDASWGEFEVTCYLVDEPPEDCTDRYAFLGLAGLRATGAREALCLGGGAVPKKELEGCVFLPLPGPRFLLFPVTRRTADGAGAERSALLDVERNPRLVVEELGLLEKPPAAPPVSGDVEVRTSRLAGAGLGLFAKRPFAVAEAIGDYVGDTLETDAAMRLADKSYLMRLGGGVFVDARRHYSVVARFVNDCRDARCHNCAFDKRPAEQRARLVCTRPVAAGDEFYASYGSFYWLGADMRKEPSARLPEEAVKALMAKEGAFWDGPRPAAMDTAEDPLD